VFVLHEHGARVHVNDADGVAAEMWETGLYRYRFVVSVTGILAIICVQYTVPGNRKTLLRIGNPLETYNFAEQHFAVDNTFPDSDTAAQQS
jgi:hypothetical protein